MRILRYLIALIAISTFSSSQIYAQCTTTIDDFPYFEGFESGSFSSHWTGAGIASGNGNQDVGWQVKSGGTNTGGTGPNRCGYRHVLRLHRNNTRLHRSSKHGPYSKSGLFRPTFKHSALRHLQLSHARKCRC